MLDSHHARRARTVALTLTLLVTSLTASTAVTAPQLSPVSASGSRDVVTVTGGAITDLDGFRYHAFLHDALDTFQGHAGGDGCSSDCDGKNHGGGGGSGFSGPGDAGDSTSGGDGGPGFGGDFLPVDVREDLAVDGNPVGEVGTVDGVERVWFAGGGGGGTFSQEVPSGTPGDPGDGGIGGGGDGAAGDPEGIAQGEHAAAHSGGGGGGSGSARTDVASNDRTVEGRGIGGDGGSGVVILRLVAQ
jgi:hypothetical protein